MSDDLERRTKPISFMVTPSQNEQIERAAASEGLARQQPVGTKSADRDPRPTPPTRAPQRDNRSPPKPSVLKAASPEIFAARAGRTLRQNHFDNRLV